MKTGAAMTSEFEQRFLTARRAVISGCFSKLNDMQRRAVLTTEGPLLLLAGAGSGKTTVLVNRVANLISFGCASDSPLTSQAVFGALLTSWVRVSRVTPSTSTRS